MKRLMILALVASLLAACEGPVQPEKIRLRYGGQIIPPDGVFVVADPEPGAGGAIVAEPGEKLALKFLIANGVRDEVFMQFDDGTAYVSSVTVYMPGEPAGRVIVQTPPPVADPSITAATYRRVRPTPRTENAVRPPVPDGYLPVSLEVALPPGAWERAEVTVVFHLHGFTRETKGEFRDTMAKTFAVVRKATTRPAGRPADTRPASPGLMYSRPLTQPAR